MRREAPAPNEKVENLIISLEPVSDAYLADIGQGSDEIGEEFEFKIELLLKVMANDAADNKACNSNYNNNFEDMQHLLPSRLQLWSSQYQREAVYCWT